MSADHPRAPQDIDRLYTSAEAYVEQLDEEGDVPLNVIRFRFKTMEVTAAGQTEGVTDWVTFTVDGLANLSEQLAVIAEQARKLEPGQLN